MHGQSRSDAHSELSATGTTLEYYLYDLSTEAQRTTLAAVLDGISEVADYNIDLTRHAVRVRTAQTYQEGTPEYFQFVAVVRQAFKTNGFVRVKEEDLGSFYPNN